MIMTQTVTAVAPGITASFLATGGTSPYVYSVQSGGAGGSINSSTGIYTAPASMNEDPAKIADTIIAQDATGARVSSQIIVGNALILFCDIIENQMGLARGRVYLWDQKIMQPVDDGLYVAVSVMRVKPFGNNISFESVGGLEATQVLNVMATLDIDIISRGPSARDQKELVLLALNSVYSEQQQEANSFHIGRLSTAFINLSEIDGAAIPYRFKISVNVQYAVTNKRQVPYYNDFATPSVVTNS